MIIKAIVIFFGVLAALVAAGGVAVCTMEMVKGIKKALKG